MVLEKIHGKLMSLRLNNGPVLSNYYVTYRCNARCGFCDIWEKPSPYVTLENAVRNLRDLRRLGVRVVDFTGGEPLLHRGLPELLKTAKSFGIITTVTTNTLLYPKMAEKLKGLVDMLHFSLDAPDEDTHNKSRGVELFGHFLESLEIASRLGERPDILYTVFSHNIDSLGEVYEKFCRPYGNMLILNPVFEYNEVGSTLSEQDLDKLETWGRKKGIYLNRGFIRLRRNGGNDPEKPVCRAGSTTVVISPENKLVLPCYHLGLREIPVEDNLFELWNSPEVQEQIRMEGRHEKCRGCTINCYMQPSFATGLSRYWLDALPSTLKYNLYKGTWKQLV